MYTAIVWIYLFTNMEQQRVKKALARFRSSELDDVKRLAKEFLLANKPAMAVLRNCGVGAWEPMVTVTFTENLYMGELLQDGEMRI